jgi:hypothetical protein
MRKNKTSKKNKTVKRNHKSLKGKWGHIGAPPKNTNWPARPFTTEQLFARNEHQCELSLRNKVNEGVEAGNILVLMPIPQPGGAVGRPKARFVMKENFDAATMTLAPVKEKVRKARKAKANVALVTVAPAVDQTPVVAPMVANEVPASPAPETPAAPAPVIIVPVATIEPVAQAQAIPLPVIA